MQISKISIQNNNSFKAGKLEIKGDWPQNISEAFKNSPYTKLLYNDTHNAVARITKHKVTYQEGIDHANHSFGDTIYRIKISLVKDNFWGRLADSLHLIPRRNFTIHKHSEDGMIKCFDEQHFEKFLKL